MKKTLLTIGLITLTGLFSFGQNVEIALHGTSPDISGSVHNEVASSEASVYVKFDVKNTGSTTEDFIITRIVLNQPAGWSNYFCWGHSTDATGGTCYPPSALPTYISGNAITMAPNELGTLQCYATPGPTGTPGTYRYYIGTVSSPKMDSIDYNLASVLSLKEAKKDISLSVSPNPASENVSIKVSNFEKGSLKIVDVLGNVVMNENYTGSKIINVEDFKNGVYFIIISGEGMNTINRKLVVRH